jgi:hypothetical protein
MGIDQGADPDSRSESGNHLSRRVQALIVAPKNRNRAFAIASAYLTISRAAISATSWNLGYLTTRKVPIRMGIPYSKRRRFCNEHTKKRIKIVYLNTLTCQFRLTLTIDLACDAIGCPRNPIGIGIWPRRSHHEAPLESDGCKILNCQDVDAKVLRLDAHRELKLPLPLTCIWM